MSDWVVRLIEQSGYLGVGFLMFLETIFPPIPSEVIMPVAGMAAAKGKLGFLPVVAAGTAGAMLGNLGWYLAPPARAPGRPRRKRQARLLARSRRGHCGRNARQHGLVPSRPRARHPPPPPAD